MPQKIHQIYDKLIKKILTLSSTAIIHLINGLFDTDYPLDSKITYNWTEFEDNNLKKILADTIITINERYSYHIEAQITKDDSIVLRVFEYGFNHALRTATEIDGIYHITFPAPIVIYLYYEGTVPNEYQLRLHFGNQQVDYNVPTLRLPETPTEELNRRKMVVLIPFYLLKLKKIMEKERSDKNLAALKNLLEHDILDSINDNLRVGNITVADAQQLKSYTHLLYNHLYSHYEEMGLFNDMMDESIMTDADIIVKECEERLNKALFDKDGIIAKKEQIITEKDIEIAKRESEIAKRESEIAEKINEIAVKDNEIAVKDNEIAVKDNEIAEKINEIAVKDNEISKMNNEISKKDNEILLLKEKIARLEGK